MTRRTKYDELSSRYERRYEEVEYKGIEKALETFAFGGAKQRSRILEVGAGTGHWLRFAALRGDSAIGLDLSAGMLARARDRDDAARILRGSAEVLPFVSGSFDRLFCVNALHHFHDPQGFLEEAFRILRPAGWILTIGLDPNVGSDDWWVYDYFPKAKELDLDRYLPSASIRALMGRAGFSACETRVVQRIRMSRSAASARKLGALDRSWTSQLAVLSEEEYAAGLELLDRQAAGSLEGGEELVLRCDLSLYATTARVA